MQPIVWRKRWQHDLTHARAGERTLPKEAHDFLVDFGLPRVMMFEWRSSFEITFAPLATELIPYSDVIRWGDFFNRELAERWSQQLVIGEEEFCNGHASFCVHKQTGVVTRIDCELSAPETFVNSTVIQFAESLLAAKEWSDQALSRGGAPTRSAFQSLASDLKVIDCRVFDNQSSFWRKFIEFILDDEPNALLITNDPSRSKPRF
jgi:hypothetical protein